MVEVKTECRECIKNDVCGVRKNFEVAIQCIKDTNTIEESNSYFEAKNNPNISVVINCPKYLKMVSQS